MKQIIEGNHASSYGARLCRVQVIAAYPITPQTQVVEKLAEFCSDGSLKARFIEVESEHSALASCIGASAAGARAFTATSAQGLALMHELLHWASGARLPIVMVNVNRAMAPPWSIWADQTDSLSQRDTGWLQFYCSSNQEVLDTVIQAYRVSEEVSLPSMVCMDAFFLSHTSEPVEIPDQGTVDAFLPAYKPRFKLDIKDPHAFGGLASPDYYYEMRHEIHGAMEEAKGLILKTGAEFLRFFGRGYSLVEEYRTEGADLLLVTSGATASTARIVIDNLREKGEKVGLLRVRVFRPFPVEEVRRVCKGVERLLVIDRNLSLGYGGIFHQEIKASLCHESYRPMIFGAVAGLGGRDITPKDLEEVALKALSQDIVGDEIWWLGLKD